MFRLLYAQVHEMRSTEWIGAGMRAFSHRYRWSAFSFLLTARIVLNVLSSFVVLQWEAYDPLTFLLSRFDPHYALRAAITSLILFFSLVEWIMAFTGYGQHFLWIVAEEFIVRLQRALIEAPLKRPKPILATKFNLKILGTRLWHRCSLAETFDAKRIEVATKRFHSKLLPNLTRKNAVKGLRLVTFLELNNFIAIIFIALNILVLVPILSVMLTSILPTLELKCVMLIDIIFIGCISLIGFRVSSLNVLIDVIFAKMISMHASHIAEQIQMAIDFSQDGKLANKLHFFQREHMRLINLAIAINNGMGEGLMTLMMAFILPSNVVLVNYLYMSHDLDVNMRYLGYLILISQLSGMMIILLVWAFLSKSLHSPGPLLVPLQGRLHGYKVLRSKMAVMKIFEMIHTNKIISASIGPISKVNSKTISEIVGFYFAFFFTLQSFFGSF